MKFDVDTTNKPNLEKAMLENPEIAREVIGTFVNLMEEAFDPGKGITWAELPGKLNEKLSFGTLIRGILRGSLDVRDLNPDMFAVIGEEVHPLSMLSPRRDPFSPGTIMYYNWRNHFRLPADAVPDEESIAKIFRKLLFFGKYVNIEKLQQAMEVNQIATFRGMGDEQIKLLPFFPALRYQREHFGDLHVGKFFDHIGAFDCGTIDLANHDGTTCPACQAEESLQYPADDYAVCPACNAGFKTDGNIDQPEQVQELE